MADGCQLLCERLFAYLQSLQNMFTFRNQSP